MVVIIVAILTIVIVIMTMLTMVEIIIPATTIQEIIIVETTMLETIIQATTIQEIIIAAITILEIIMLAITTMVIITIIMEIITRIRATDVVDVAEGGEDRRRSVKILYGKIGALFFILSIFGLARNLQISCIKFPQIATLLTR